MCMVEYCDEIFEPLGKTVFKARKPHRCGECRRTIEPGETYERHAGPFDGQFTVHKTCRHCVAVREWLLQVCSGWMYGSVSEDLYEHFREGYGLWLGRAVVGMQNHWKGRSGSLMEPMALPATLPTGP